MVGDAELANQKILEESSRNEWEESLHSNQLVMSQSLRNNTKGRGSLQKVSKKMGGTFKSPKGIKMGGDAGISEDVKSISNSYSQNYDDDEFEVLSKSQMSQSRGNSIVGGFNKSNAAKDANDSKTDASYSMTFEDSSTVNVNISKSKRSNKSDENTGKHSSISRKKIDIKSSTTKPIKEV